jgi:hypothetical protein
MNSDVAGFYPDVYCQKISKFKGKPNNHLLAINSMVDV